ncbi:unnamed protein product [Mytilus edulis]|uniref:EGF-like domain-containing protein n=1 Tax=Mytilus edulis TaxID=6550 RepID=A0A8S3V493_MYTED|nr:unnamed protein product [Mytilus edulis]
MWMDLDFGNPNGWSLQTTIDLRLRDDINSTNSSPITTSQPLHTLQFSCYHELKLPMYDPDGDLVKCRWAVGKECDSVCHAMPSASLDEDTCTLKFNATSGSSYTNDGWYAVALTIEDFPTKTIHIGKEQFNETTPMSTVPLQFLIHLVGKSSPCNWKPEFVSPTPPAGTKISISAGNSFTQKIYAANLADKNETVTKLSLTRPAGMVLKGPTNLPNRAGVVFWEMSWTPTVNDKGNHIVCGMAEDSTGFFYNDFLPLDSDATDPCNPNPCNKNQSCSRIGSSFKVECVCPKKMRLIGQVCIADHENTIDDINHYDQAGDGPTTTKTIATKSTTMPTTTLITKTTSTTTQQSTTPLTPKSSTTTKSRKYAQTTTQKTTSHMRSTNIIKQIATVVNLHSKVIKATSTSIQTASTMNTSQNGDSVKLGKTSNVHKKTSGHICFKSEPVILFTIFFSILLFALGAVGGILGYKVINKKNQLKVMNSSNDSFDINSEK